MALPFPIFSAARLLLGLAMLGLAGLRAQPASPATLAPMNARIEICETILREFQADSELAIPAEVLRAARAIIVVNQVKGGLVLGLQYGYGVVLARRADGEWSTPGFVRAGEASLGLQLGGKRTETLYLLMDDAPVRALFQGRLNIGVDALAVAGPRSFESELVNRDILATPVLVYARNLGYYAGATIKTGWIERNDPANRTYYDTSHTLPEILYGDVVTAPPAVRPLMDYVTAITR